VQVLAGLPPGDHQITAHLGQLHAQVPDEGAGHLVGDDRVASMVLASHSHAAIIPDASRGESGR
jgi:hypothetical protein